MIMGIVKMSFRDKTTLFMLVFMSIFLLADQRIMSAILPELSREYGVSDWQLGLIGSAFVLVGSIVSILFGYYTDKFSRKWLLIATVLVGEIPCLFSGLPFFTKTLGGFVFWRVLSGIGVGGIFPISLSLLADYFKEEHRATASAWLQTAWAVGSIVGVAVAGFMTNKFGWRISFVLIALPNLPLALIFALFAKDPQRGRTEDALEDLIQKGLAYKQVIHLSDFKIIFGNRTNLWTFIQAIPGTVPWGILGYWIIHFFENVRHVSKEKATTIFLILGLGATLGIIFFGYVGEWLYRKNPKYNPLMCGFVVLLGCIPAFMLVNISFDAAGAGFYAYLCLAFLMGFLVVVAAPNCKAILMNVNRPEHRGTVFACYNITENINQGLGPMIGGLLLPFGYLFMMNFSIFWWVPCGLMLLIVARFITFDRDALRKLLEERAEEMKKE
jgi:MFS family permease